METNPILTAYKELTLSQEIINRSDSLKSALINTMTAYRGKEGYIGLAKTGSDFEIRTFTYVTEMAQNANYLCRLMGKSEIFNIQESSYPLIYDDLLD